MLRDKRMTAITFGTFDLTHAGHFNLFKRMKERFGRVCVFVQDSYSVPITKNGHESILGTRDRLFSVRSCKYVDEAHSYRWIRTRNLSRVDFDVLVVGPEHVKDERFKALFRWCVKHGKKVYVMPRTNGISTTEIIERVVEDSENGSRRKNLEAS